MRNSICISVALSHLVNQFPLSSVNGSSASGTSLQDADAGGQSPRRKLSRSPTSGQGGAGVEEPVYAAGEEPAGHMSNDGDGWSIGGHGEMEGDASEGEGDRGRAVGSGEGLSEEAAVAAALQAQKELKEARAAGGGLARSRSSSRNFQPSEPAQAEWVCMGQNGVDLTWREEVRRHTLLIASQSFQRCEYSTCVMARSFPSSRTSRSARPVVCWRPRSAASPGTTGTRTRTSGLPRPSHCSCTSTRSCNIGASEW